MIRHVGKIIADTMVKILYPPVCPVCGEVQPQMLTDDGIGRICEPCKKRVQRVHSPFCMRCGKPLARIHAGVEYCEDCRRHRHSYTQGRAAFVYRGAMIGTMHRLKYSNRRDYAPVLARETYGMYADWIRRIQPQVIVPVPLHPSRRRSRGYNQAELLARELSRLSGIPMDTGLLIRVHNTDRQRTLSPQERKNNLKNAFQMTKKIVQLEKVLLIDDIYTTGSTADAAADALHMAGIRDVYLLCICIGGEEQGGLEDGSKNMQVVRTTV